MTPSSAFARPRWRSFNYSNSAQQQCAGGEPPPLHPRSLLMAAGSFSPLQPRSLPLAASSITACVRARCCTPARSWTLRGSSSLPCRDKCCFSWVGNRVVQLFPSGTALLSPSAPRPCLAVTALRSPWAPRPPVGLAAACHAGMGGEADGRRWPHRRRARGPSGVVADKRRLQSAPAVADHWPLMATRRREGARHGVPRGFRSCSNMIVARVPTCHSSDDHDAPPRRRSPLVRVANSHTPRTVARP